MACNVTTNTLNQKLYAWEVTSVYKEDIYLIGRADFVGNVHPEPASIPQLLAVAVVPATY